MKTSTFVNELTKSSAVFGRKHDVKVVFTGNQAATNGETIMLPAIDRNSTMTDEQMDILRGYVDHESGHVKHTNHAAVQRLARECKANGDMHLKFCGMHSKTSGLSVELSKTIPARLTIYEPQLRR